MKTLACIALILLLITNVHGQLSSTFYDKSCPRALSIVQAAVTLAVLDQPSHFKRVGASLLRLHFHDCFVNGCDGSILLDDIPPTFTGEKTAVQNKNFPGLAFEVIGTIKDKVEVACSGVVSCADIVAIAARDSVVLLGGPTWTVLLGRRDSTTASLSAANKYLPSPASDLSALIKSFQEKGLSTKDLVALSGAHTIGYAHCTNFRDRIYNESNIDPSFATSLKAICPSSGGHNNLTHLDLNTSTKFDNNYYSNLRIKKGLLHSDQQLFNGGSTDSQVTTYSTNQDTFFTDFGAAMVNMGNIEPLTGSSGQIRKYCNKSN